MCSRYFLNGFKLSNSRVLPYNHPGFHVINNFRHQIIYRHFSISSFKKDTNLQFNHIYSIGSHKPVAVYFSTSPGFCNKHESVRETRTKLDIPPIDPDNIDKSDLLPPSLDHKRSLKADVLEKDDKDDKSHISNKNDIEMTPNLNLPEKNQVGIIRRIGKRIKDEFVHYANGIKLLGLDIKIAVTLLFRVAKTGDNLSRRERKQLIRTVADIFRMVPFLIFILVPMMEFFIPVYLKIFPNMLPSTFQEKSKQKEKARSLLKIKLEMAKFLQETLKESIVVEKGENAPSVQEFVKFLKDVRESKTVVNTQDIMRFTFLFEDEITLDTISPKQLAALCKLLNISPIGPYSWLRFQLWMRMRALKAEDKMLAQEDLTKLPVWELQELCRDRGMRAIGATEDRLRFQLDQWLSLHLEKKVPVALLLLTRTMYLPDYHTAEEQLKMAIVNLPEAAEKEAQLKVSKVKGERVDHRTKIEVLKEQERVIDEERQQIEEKKKQEELKDSAPVIKPSPMEELSEGPVISDTAPQLTPSHPEKDAIAMVTKGMGAMPSELSEDISVEDLVQIESAIISLEESQKDLDKQQVEEIKEDAEDMLRSHDLMVQESAPMKRSAKKLCKKLDKMISALDKHVVTLHEEREQLLDDIKLGQNDLKQYEQSKDSDSDHSDLLQQIEEKHDRVVSINDLMMSMRRIQKIPDDTRIQKILEVLDEDSDGNIEMHHVVEVLEILGRENVKISNKEMCRIVDMIDSETRVESQDRTDANQTGSNVNETPSSATDTYIPQESDKEKL